MTSQYELEIFSQRFDDAVNQMHTERQDRPSDDVWQSLISTERRAETADLRASGADLVAERLRPEERTPHMDTSLRAPATSAWNRPHFDALTRWLSIAASFVLVAGMALAAFNMNRDSGDGTDQPAWAPMGSTPAGTPDANYVAISDDVVCQADPLTKDEVMNIVMNPLRAEDQLMNLPTQWPDERMVEPLMPGISNWENLQEPTSSEDIQELLGFANRFWGCVMAGSTYQVWSMMSPVAVQAEILANFPVLRSIDEIESYVVHRGPEPYDQYVTPLDGPPVRAFVSSNMPDRNEAMLYAANDGERIGLDSQDSELRFATVPMFFAEDQSTWFVLHVQQFPTGEWRAVFLSTPFSRG